MIAAIDGLVFAIAALGFVVAVVYFTERRP